MSDSNRLLELIQDGVVTHGGDLGGWTRRTDGELHLFDGRVTLRAEVKDDDPSATGNAVHAHVLTTLHEYDGDVLDACLLGVGDGRDAALGEAALVWMTGVAGPIRSFLDDKPAGRALPEVTRRRAIPAATTACLDCAPMSDRRSRADSTTETFSRRWTTPGRGSSLRPSPRRRAGCTSPRLSLPRKAPGAGAARWRWTGTTWLTTIPIGRPACAAPMPAS
jgi:hypothetical protein